MGVGSTLVAVSLLAVLAAYLHAPTRPLVRRWWWVAVVPLAVVAGAVLELALRGGRTPTPIGRSSVADEALARAADADAEFARQRLAARRLDSGGAHLADFDARVSQARAITDPVARRAALVAAVEAS